MVCSCVFVMKVLDIRCESYVFFIIRLCVVVGRFFVFYGFLGVRYRYILYVKYCCNCLLIFF